MPLHRLPHGRPAAALPAPSLAVACMALALAGCATTQTPAPATDAAAAPLSRTAVLAPATAASSADYAWLNRLTWGATATDAARLAAQGRAAWLDAQLRPAPDAPLPAAAQEQIAALTIASQPIEALGRRMEQQRKDADALADDEAKKAARDAYQKEMTRLGRESMTRHLLRALYSPAQVQERMTWFWLNHFSVHQYKSNVRVVIGDYEDNAIRRHALGRFRDLLGAVALHPAMLRYLDNDQNAAGRINENFARELMELHTLGVDGGYSQADVQELARVLTGVGVNFGDTPKLRPEQQRLYVRRGLFEFNPGRHDSKPKTLLGAAVPGEGMAEVNAALDRLARHPATARFVSRKLAQYWLADTPPEALVARMAETFGRTDGDIAQVLRTLFTSPEFTQAPGDKFKDPMQYVVSAVRLAYDDKVILNTQPMVYWLDRLGEPLYGRQTPDGYPMTAGAWSSPGQMATRFEIAKNIGSSHAGLFRVEAPTRREQPAFPQLANALYWQSIRGTLGEPTLHALEQAASPQEWNTFLLSAPEMMKR